MSYPPHTFIRAMVRREAENWWAEVPTKDGKLLTLDLNGQSSGSRIDYTALKPGIPARVKPLLQRATVTDPAPDPVYLAGPTAKQWNLSGGPQALMNLCWPPFVEHEGCVFRGTSPHKFPSLAKFQDRTAAEAFVNHVHLNDVFRNPDGGYQYRWGEEECVRIAMMWMYKLRVEFPRRRFVVYLFVDSDDSHIRFHTLRRNEPLWTDLDLLFDDVPVSSTVWFI